MEEYLIDDDKGKRMNVYRIKSKRFIYLEGFWSIDENGEKVDLVDENDKKHPYPEARAKKWKYMYFFTNKLKMVQDMKNTKTKKIEKYFYKDCVICGQSNILTIKYTNNDIIWRDDLLHYVLVHNLKPTNQFIKFIMYFIIPAKQNYKNKGLLKTSLKSNQLHILDSFLYHGKDKNIYSEGDSNFKLSEQSGFFDFNEDGLETLLVDTTKKYVATDDPEIFLPNNRPDVGDYEYIYHTHPLTGKEGGRAKDGILYELPSIHDIYHFIYNYNYENVQGSMVSTAEGMYIIKSTYKKKKKGNILYMSASQHRKFVTLMYKLQDEAIKKYGTKFKKEFFYSVIAQDRTVINKLNKLLKVNNIVIEYYPRVKNKKGKWVNQQIDIEVTIFEPIY